VKMIPKRTGGTSLEGLLATRRGALAVALACAVAAAAILIIALSQYQSSVTRHTQQTTVLVSTAEIPKGTAIDTVASRGWYKLMPVLQGQVSPGAILNAGALSGTVAATTILPGQQLTSADFTSVGQSGIVSQLAPSERGLEVSLDQAHGLGTVLETGDQVDVYGSYTFHDQPVVSLLESDVPVLKAGSTGTSTTGAASSGNGSVVLGVSEPLVEKVEWVADNGKVWLALRPTAASNTGQNVSGVNQVAAGNNPKITINGASATLSETSPVQGGS
jgi:Flp pilus assembly protein CpaB